MFSAFGSYMQNLVGVQSDEAKRQKQLEAMRLGSTPIAFDLESVNFDHLRRKRAFYRGVNIQLTAEEEKDKGEYLDFTNVPDILPLKPKTGMADLDYNELAKSTLSAEEQKEKEDSATPGPHPHLYDYNNAEEGNKNAYLERFDLIRKRKINFKESGQGKPVAIIYNPVAGSGVDRVEDIRGLFFTKDIPHEVLPSEEHLAPFRMALELDLDKYSVLAIAGGDGTVNQVVNGMLARPDGKRLPIGVIPLGQSNDFARSLGINTTQLEQAVANIAKAEAIAIDTTRVLLDHDTEAELPEGSEERLNLCRHMLSNACLSMPAKIANSASSWKGLFGSSSFSVSTYLQAFSCGFVQDTYNLLLDDEPFSQGGLNTALMTVTNGKFASGGMIMNPFAAVNDGLIDITWIQDPSYQGTFGVTGVFSDASGRGGIQVYKKHSAYVRGRKIKIEVPPKQISTELDLGDDDAPLADPQATPDATPAEDGSGEPQAQAAATAETATPAAPATPTPPETQVVVIDGEALNYEKSVAWECFPGNVEVMIDDCYFVATGTFETRLTPEVEKQRVIQDIVDRIWLQFDKDNSGALDRDETRRFLQSVLIDMSRGSQYQEELFEETFTAFDKNGNGLIEKDEMTFFIEKLLD